LEHGATCFSAAHTFDRSSAQRPWRPHRQPRGHHTHTQIVRNQQKKKGREEEYFGLKKKQVLLAPQGKEEKGVFDLWLDDPIGATQRLARDGHISPRPLPAIESVALGTI
jgi:hypothetical protein